jgi:hypothetical protein
MLRLFTYTQREVAAGAVHNCKYLRCKQVPPLISGRKTTIRVRRRSMKTVPEKILLSLYFLGGKQLLALLIMAETLRADKRDHEHSTMKIDQDIPVSENGFQTVSDRLVDRGHRLRRKVVTRPLPKSSLRVDLHRPPCRFTSRAVLANSQGHIYLRKRINRSRGFVAHTYILLALH